LPDVREKPKKRAFKKYPIGYFHIDIAEVHTEEGKLYLFVATGRTSKLAYAELHERQTRRIAADFLRSLIDVVPYHLHTVFTTGGIQFTHRKTDRQPSCTCLTASAMNTASITGSRSRITRGPTEKPERMNRTLKDATVKRYHLRNP
jgi:hypothetical protein